MSGLRDQIVARYQYEYLFVMKTSEWYAHPSNGGPKYTIDTSVFPYTADIDGYSLLSGKPAKYFSVTWFVSTKVSRKKVIVSWVFP